jgi:type II secretory pathway pseudopilin PulG
VCGVLALVVLPVFPLSLLLGIIAILQGNKAKRLAHATPGAYRVPGSAGVIMGALVIVLLPLLTGILAAVAIPAFVQFKAGARNAAALSDLRVGLTDLATAYEDLKASPQSDAQVVQGLSTHLADLSGHTRNPWNPAVPAYAFEIKVVTGLTPEEVEGVAKARAVALGQGAFVVQLPETGGGDATREGVLAGAVLLKGTGDGPKVVAKSMPLG